MLPNRWKFNLFLDLEYIFDRLAHEASFGVYNNLDHPVRTFSKQFILNHVSKEHRVLDLGCKEGEISSILAAAAQKVIGIDHDEAAIKRASERFQIENLTFENREAFGYLSERGHEFDVLILSHILEHLEEPAQFLRKFKDFFKYIYIEIPDFDKTYLNHYRLMVKRNLVYTDDDHVSEFDRQEIKAILDDCQISVVEEEFRFGVQKYWCKTQA